MWTKRIPRDESLGRIVYRTSLGIVQQSTSKYNATCFVRANSGRTVCSTKHVPRKQKQHGAKTDKTWTHTSHTHTQENETKNVTIITVRVFPLMSTSAAVHPLTQHLPIPRATTAACEVMPPNAVSTPAADFIPWMSSGVVSLRTRITSSPMLAMVSASSGVNTTLPVAAPGDAGRPSPIRVWWFD